MTITIPIQVQTVLTRLEAAGHEACVVGGCVRDSLLGQKPNDWDVATSALPEQTKRALFGLPVIDTGLAHGTVTAVLDSMPVEITTYRVDGAYTDGRRPDTVSFTGSLEEDLARRDFTINALAWRKGKLLDPFGGRADLNRSVLRCVGDPNQRFQEDALRILRALRFSSTLGFSIESATSKSLLDQRGLLGRIAAERVYAELCKLLCGKHVEQILLQYFKVLSEWIPEIEPAVGFDQHSPYHSLDVWGHIVRSVASVEPTRLLRLAMLFHDIGKPRCFTMDAQGCGHFYGHQELSAAMTKEILERLRADRATIETVCVLVRYHDLSITTEKRLVKRWLNRLGEERFSLLLQVNRADTLAHSLNVVQGRLEMIEQEYKLFQSILAENACFSLRDLAVSGRDLIELGVPPGPQLGQLLNRLLDMVIEEASENEREPLLKLARKEWTSFDP